jgi:hypothetical protein
VLPLLVRLAGDAAVLGEGCAHAAAARAYVQTVARYAELTDAQALLQVDANGRTACNIARMLPRDLGDETVALLSSVGACGDGKMAIKKESGPRVWRLSSFDSTAHVLGGWRLASPAQLLSLGLPEALFTSSPDDAGSVAYEEDVAVHSASALKEGLDRTWPFVVRRAFDPASILQGEQSLPSARGPSDPARPGMSLRQLHEQVVWVGAEGGTGTGLPPFMPRLRLPDPLPLKDVLHKLGGLSVDSGAVPYAATYGLGGNRTTVGDFVTTHMGNALSRGGMVELLASTAGEGTTTHRRTELPAGAWEGPGADSALPPYIFDGASMRLQPQLFSSYTIPPALADLGAVLRQFIVGPPLSGAMPHFHGAAANQLLVGVKLWLLYPPRHAFFADAHVRSWYEGLRNGSHPGVRPPPLQFLQEAGDLVYLPEHWGHAVVNLADTVAIALE